MLTAYAAAIRTERLCGQIAVLDDLTGNRIGSCDLIRGFAYYYGAKGSAHEGVSAIVRGGLEGLTRALTTGLRNGRDDRDGC